MLNFKTTKMKHSIIAINNIFGVINSTFLVLIILIWNRNYSLIFICFTLLVFLFAGLAEGVNNLARGSNLKSLLVKFISICMIYGYFLYYLIATNYLDNFYKDLVFKPITYKLLIGKYFKDVDEFKDTIKITVQIYLRMYIIFLILQTIFIYKLRSKRFLKTFRQFQKGFL